MQLRETLGNAAQDLRYAIRSFRHDAGFAAFAILIIGLGIGASATVFSLANALLVRPLPFRDPSHLVWVANTREAGLSGQTVQVGNFLDLSQQNRSFAELAAYFAFYGVGDSKLTGQGEPERLTAVPVSQNFFSLLGVHPLFGRDFNADESAWHGPKAAVLSHGLWERRFASDPRLVGQTLMLDGDPVTVVGVLPASFDFASIFAPGTHVDLFVPFPLTAETNRWGNTLSIVGRLKPGVAVGAANAELTVLEQQITQAHPERNRFTGTVSPLEEHVTGRIRSALVVLGWAVAVVMLIVCANLSSLLLARATTRQRELAIRSALGAGRRRLIQQMLTESIVLAVCGAVAGIVLAELGTRAIAHMDAIGIPLLQRVHIDATALGFTLLLTLVAGVTFGVVPAFQIPSATLNDALKDSGRGSTEGRRRPWMRSSLVVSEIALACVLIVGAGLLIRSFLKVLDVDLGFRPERAATLRVDPDQRYKTQAEFNAYVNEVLRLARTVPGVEGAGLTDALPLGHNRTWGVAAQGAEYEKGKRPSAFVRVVSDGYITTMGIPIRGGRDLTASDAESSEPVIMVNETMAKTLWPGQNAVGKIVRADTNRRVIGVVGDVRHLALEKGSGNEMYLPIRQIGDFASVDLVVRTTLPPARLASSIRTSLASIAPTLATNEFRTLEQLVDSAVSPRRFVVLLLGGFAGFALILALLGIYGVISYTVDQRTQEIGIRMALGASANQLQARIILQTLGLAGIGVGIGTIAAWALARALNGFLFGVTASDPVTFAGMLAILTVVAAVAGYLPARRASRIDPLVALRSN